MASNKFCAHLTCRCTAIGGPALVGHCRNNQQLFTFLPVFIFSYFYILYGMLVALVGHFYLSDAIVFNVVMLQRFSILKHV